jgi:putative transposase
MYPESVLNRILFATRYTRHLNRLGYLRVQDWKLYGEAGLSGEPVTVWVYDGRITVEYQAVTLSKYSAQLTPDRKQITQVRHPHLAQTPFRSPQLTLIDLGPNEWCLYWRAPSYQRRPRRSLLQGVVQLPLFELSPLDMAVGTDTARVEPNARTHLYSVGEPNVSRGTEE